MGGKNAATEEFNQKLERLPGPRKAISEKDQGLKAWKSF